MGCLLLVQALACAQPVSLDACKPWPRWDMFKANFVSPDGRVIDVGSADTRTVSEGQAYGLFFALVAGDRPEFDKILEWTEANLAEGDLIAHLPAWLWGQKKDGSWGVLDSNSASDADLWIAYSLLQAGRDWHERRYIALGNLLAKRILQQETATLPGLGLSLLPGPVGFQLGPQTWRLNPSYVPLQLLQGLATALPEQTQWKQMRAPALRLMIETATRGFAPDWAEYHASDNTAEAHDTDRGTGFAGDAATAAVGSYDAIRVYLWTGMLASADPARARLLKAFQPMAEYIGTHGFPPEKIDTVHGNSQPQAGPSGFSAAVLPFLDSSDRAALANAQMARVNTLEQQAPAGYFSQVLSLFGTGWHEARYRFAADGSLRPAWGTACSPGSH